MKEKRIEEYIPILGKVSVNFTSISCDVFEHFLSVNEIERQQNIDQLGLIAHSFPTLYHSRFDYLILQCVLSEIVENSFKGTTSAQGEVKINNEKIRGNDVIKTWMLFSNFGHCQNTIGDEKSILLYCLENKKFKSYLLSQIKDPELKDWSKIIIERLDYIKFHHVISIIRIYKTLKRRTRTQKKYLMYYKLLLLPLKQIESIASNSNKINQLRTIFDNIRNLAIIALDSRNSSLPIKLEILPTIVSFDFYLDKFRGLNISSLYDPLINLLYDKLYLAKESQARQRAYEINSIRKMRKVSNKEILELAIYSGISNPELCKLQHFIRKEYKMTERDKFRDIFNLSQEIKNHTRTKLIESSADFNFITKKAVIDFYIFKDQFKNKNLPELVNGYSLISNKLDIKSTDKFSTYEPFINQIIIGAEKEGIPKEKTKNIFTPLIKYIHEQNLHSTKPYLLTTHRTLLWTIIRYHLKDQYYFDIDSAVKSEDHVGVKLSTGEDYLSPKVISKKINSIDPDRGHELGHLLQGIKRKFDGTIIASTERIKIYDYSKAPSKRPVTDIDSVILKFNSNSLILEFNESKNTDNPINDAKKDVKKMFLKVLNKNAKGYRIENTVGFGVKLRIKHGT